MESNFLAIDFETANYSRDSACSVGIVRVEKSKIVHKAVHLIRPPSREFVFTYIHGITWNDVKIAPTFKEVWINIKPYFEGIDFLAAHNAGFDSGVLKACCATYGIIPPVTPFKCSMALARKIWNLRPTKLSDVCNHLDIELNHHEALSDAHACAQIIISAEKIQSSKMITAKPTLRRKSSKSAEIAQ